MGRCVVAVEGLRFLRVVVEEEEEDFAIFIDDVSLLSIIIAF